MNDFPTLLLSVHWMFSLHEIFDVFLLIIDPTDLGITVTNPNIQNVSFVLFCKFCTQKLFTQTSAYELDKSG